MVLDLDACCKRALEHGLGLDVPHVGCGDCGTEWFRSPKNRLEWVSSDGLLIEVSVDETEMTQKRAS